MLDILTNTPVLHVIFREGAYQNEGEYDIFIDIICSNLSFKRRKDGWQKLMQQRRKVAVVTQVGRDFMFLCCREGDRRELKLLVHAGGLVNTTKSCGRTGR